MSPSDLTAQSILIYQNNVRVKIHRSRGRSYISSCVRFEKLHIVLLEDKQGWECILPLITDTYSYAFILQSYQTKNYCVYTLIISNLHRIYTLLRLLLLIKISFMLIHDPIITIQDCCGVRALWDAVLFFLDFILHQTWLKSTG